MIKLEQIVILFFILFFILFLILGGAEFGYIKGQYNLLIEDNKIFEHEINDSMEVIKILRDENSKLKERYYGCNIDLELIRYKLSIIENGECNYK